MKYSFNFQVICLTSGLLDICAISKAVNWDDLQPINGCFWSGVKMAQQYPHPPGWPFQPWSDTGHKTQFNNGVKVAQPNNAEFEINGSLEACLVRIRISRNEEFFW